MQIATRNGGPGAINTIARVGDINLYDSVPGRCFRALCPKAFMVQFVPWSDCGGAHSVGINMQYLKRTSTGLIYRLGRELRVRSDVGY